MSHEQPQDLSTTDTEQKPPQSKQLGSFAEKTDRIKAWSQLVKSITPYLWAAVIIIVLIPLVGRGLIASSASGNPVHTNNLHNNQVIIARTQPTKDLDTAIVAAMRNAHSQSVSFASEQLDLWVKELMNRVDHSFLDWYFNYFNQKKLEFRTPFVWLSSAVAHWADTNNPPPGKAVAEKLTEDFQTEFSKRVLRPQIAQLELEKITRDTINLYVAELGNNISEIQSSYQIPQGEWERYLSDIAITINDTEGNISNLSLKILTGGSAYLVAKAMVPVVTKVGSKIAASFAGKASAKMAAKTGGAVAAKVGAEFLDPIVGIGIIAWDLWDHNHTVAVEKPILRSAIYDYLKQVQSSLLDNPENGIMAAINQLESGILKSITSVSQSA